jgi:spore coat polysaccharide biosynthesis protein SpsF (cytidylyltransferase family)/aryl-alcohol dehydrogenase-like predicted oxidoreductase
VKSLIILQARTSSTRLPGKVLLPVAGHPSSVLAALRAANQGMQLVVATSDDPTDDHLAAVLQNHGVQVFRGPMSDVLARYFLAAANLTDECAVIRLTGDNVVPDGEFVAELVSAFSCSGLEYLRGNSSQSKLPYGLGGEAFSVAALRKAHSRATSAYDREHVGPWMARHCKAGVYVPASLRGADYSHLRCTIDDEEDYQRALRLFDGVKEPLKAGWYGLMQRLASLPGEPSFRVPYRIVQGSMHGEMTLGTVQLGTKYGIVNRTGQPARATARALVRRAIAHGVTHLDTARSYGESEEVLADALAGAWRSRVEVVTKLDPLEFLSRDASSAMARAAVEESVRQSCLALETQHLPVLLLHRWRHWRAWKGEAWRQLLELRARGVIGRLGASVYAPEEALEALSDPDIRHLQIPLNVLDHRWKQGGVDRAAARRDDVVVHARSAFLQGILLHPAEFWPMAARNNAGSYLGPLGHMAQKFERRSVADLCLAYVRSQSWITSVVVGCETPAQLDEDLGLFRLPKLSSEQCEELESSIPYAPVELLNPSKWDLTHAPTATH